MLHAEGLGEFRLCAETEQERIGKAVGNLKAHTQKHGEDKEDGHLLLLEQREGTQAEGINKALFVRTPTDFALRQRKGIEEQNDAHRTGSDKLVLVALEAQKVDQPHGKDESDRSEYTYRGKVLHRVHAGIRQGTVGNRVGKCQRRHIECYRQRIKREDNGELRMTAHTQTVAGRGKHEQTCNQMAETQQPLCRHPTVGYDTHQGRHENRHHTLHGIKQTYLRTDADITEIATHRGQISPPHCKLQKVHQCQTYLQIHVFSN